MPKLLHPPPEVILVLQADCLDSVGGEEGLQTHERVNLVRAVVWKIHLTLVKPVVLRLRVLGAHRVKLWANSDGFHARLTRTLQLAWRRKLPQAPRIQL